MQKNVLLTGGSGFIGKNIKESYLAEKYNIFAPTSKELNLADTASVDEYFKDKNFCATIHSAAKPGHRAATDLDKLSEKNMSMFFNLIRQGEKCGRLINIGSGAIYDSSNYCPNMPEDYFGKHIPKDTHGFTKYVLGKYMEICKEDAVDLRVFGIFGKWEDYSIRFPSNVICKVLFGIDPSCRQDRVFSYLYVDDLMPILEFFIENKPEKRAYNVCPPEKINLLGILDIVEKIHGKRLNLRLGAEGMGMEYSGSTQRICEEYERRIGKKYADLFTPLSEALGRLYNWYRERKQSGEIDIKLLLEDK